MGDMGDTFRAFREHSKEKKCSNFESSIDLLKNRGIEFAILSEESKHLRVGAFDFWPSTGKFYNQKTKHKGRGVFKFMKLVQLTQPPTGRGRRTYGNR